jgi:hypothetical protein
MATRVGFHQGFNTQEGKRKKDSSDTPEFLGLAEGVLERDLDLVLTRLQESPKYIRMKPIGLAHCWKLLLLLHFTRELSVIGFGYRDDSL